MPQIALNWLLQRPTVARVIIGARNEEQLRQNLGAVGWNLTPEQVAKLDAASAVRPRIRTGIRKGSPSAIRRRCERAVTQRARLTRVASAQRYFVSEAGAAKSSL